MEFLLARAHAIHRDILPLVLILRKLGIVDRVEHLFHDRLRPLPSRIDTRNALEVEFLCLVQNDGARPVRNGLVPIFVIPVDIELKKREPAHHDERYERRCKRKGANSHRPIV